MPSALVCLAAAYDRARRLDAKRYSPPWQCLSSLAGERWLNAQRSSEGLFACARLFLHPPA
jgi:hypothetical protein